MQDLYGYGEDGQLYRVDPATATTTPIASVDRLLGSLALNPVDGTLYAQVDATSPANPNAIVVVNKATGATTQTPYNGGKPLLLAITSDNMLFTQENDLSQNQNLFGRLDMTTWQHQILGGTDYIGLGFAASGTGLYVAGQDNQSLYTLDRSNGALSVAATLQGDGSRYVASMTFDRNGILYAALVNDAAPDGEKRTLVTVDLATGALTPKGSLGKVYMLAFDKPAASPDGNDPASGDSAAPPPAPASDDSDPGSGGSAAPPPAPASTVVPTSTTPPQPSAEPLLSALVNKLVRDAKRASTRALLKSGGLSHRLLMTQRGTLAVRWLHSRRAGGKPVVVASGRNTAARPGLMRLRLRLTAAGRKRLGSVRRIPLTVKAVFTPAGGAPATAVRRFVRR